MLHNFEILLISQICVVHFIIHDNICKQGAFLLINYLPYVKHCIVIPEDSLSIDHTYGIHVKAFSYFIEFKWCQTEHVKTVIN